MAFAKSRPKVYDKDERRVTFDDVAGNDEVVAELREVVEFLRTPEKYQALGGRIPKGVLLVGPPGTGKTLLAKAVAGEAGVPFFSLSGSDFVEMFVGVGAARVRSLFAQAEAKAPCLIFIDELDALGKARGTGGPGSHDERDQTLNQLLVEMDGFDSNRGIILIAATNRPETLDAALVRPGRFDRQVVVDRPDITGREQILKVHARTVALDDEINLRQIAAMTPGFVGADLANLVNEAALLAARKGKDKVGRVEFEEGVERVIAGPEKKQRVLRARREAADRLPRGRPRPGRPQPARDRPGPQGLDPRPRQRRARLHDVPPRGRPLPPHPELAREHDLHACSAARSPRRSSTARSPTAHQRPPARHPDRPQDGRRVRHEPRLGRVSYQTEGRSPFLPGGGANDYAWSEQTAREIDLEVRRVLDESQDAAHRILTDRRAALEEITRRCSSASRSTPPSSRRSSTSSHTPSGPSRRSTNRRLRSRNRPPPARSRVWRADEPAHPVGSGQGRNRPRNRSVAGTLRVRQRLWVRMATDRRGLLLGRLLSIASRPRGGTSQDQERHRWIDQAKEQKKAGEKLHRLLHLKPAFFRVVVELRRELTSDRRLFFKVELVDSESQIHHVVVAVCLYGASETWKNDGEKKHREYGQSHDLQGGDPNGHRPSPTAQLNQAETGREHEQVQDRGRDNVEPDDPAQAKQVAVERQPVELARELRSFLKLAESFSFQRLFLDGGSGREFLPFELLDKQFSAPAVDVLRDVLIDVERLIVDQGRSELPQFHESAKVEHHTEGDVQHTDGSHESLRDVNGKESRARFISLPRIGRRRLPRADSPLTIFPFRRTIGFNTIGHGGVSPSV